jgi:hypothetical protein
MTSDAPLFAGAATADITPNRPIFLAGYPNVRRDSTGVHDPLLSTAQCLRSGDTRVLVVANDVIYVSKALVARARQRIEAATGIPSTDILISASHTHSGPKTLDPIATSGDEVVPPTDPAYVRQLEDGIVGAGTRAAGSLVPAEVGMAVADAEGVGTNRRDPAGPKDLAVPVLVVRDLSHKPLAAMLVCSMHPTVLHEDSTLVSGDFPGLARLHLQRDLLGQRCPVLYHTGPAGNQSPRHVTKANTFAEADRLGRILADAAMKVIPSIEFRQRVALEARGTSVSLPLRTFMTESDAQVKLDRAEARLKKLRDGRAPRTEMRTAEVDWFGAQETLTLARAAATGEIKTAAAEALPAEVQAILIGPWTFVAWPGEMFIEFALDVKRRCPDTFLINYANGDLQGYLVTRQAAEEGGYESSNAIFKSPESGEMLVRATLELLNK